MFDDDTTRVRRETVGWCLLSLVFVLPAAAVGALVVRLAHIPADSLWCYIVPEMTVALFAMTCVTLIGGRRFVAPSARDIGCALRLGWWAIFVSVGFALLEGAVWFASEGELPLDWRARLAETALFCLLVGLFEEALFRGIVFQGLLAWLGGTPRGVVRAILVTSLLFGLMHVDVRLALTDWQTMVQALLKVVQTGMYSLLLCAIVLRTRRMVGVAVLHGLEDLLILLPSIVLSGEPFDTEYVTAGEDARYVIVLYLIVIVLYLPLVVVAVRELRRRRHEGFGAFVEFGLERELERRSGGGSGQVPQGPAPAPSFLPAPAPGQGPVPPTSPVRETPPAPDGFPQAVEPSVSQGRWDPCQRGQDKVNG